MSTNLEQIVEINYETKLAAVESVFKSWSKWILTPLGKITVIKRIAVPKLNHFLGLPNSSVEIIKRLKNLCYDFLWKGGPDRIKRSVIVQGYEKGGLRMIDIENIIDALKISWIRREILEDKDVLKFITLYILLHKRSFCAVMISLKIIWIIYMRNPFWRDTYKALYTFTSSFQLLSWDDYLSTPVWFNSNIKVGRRSCFIRDWSEHGIFFITVVLDRRGNFLSLRGF